jgi:hypothetical protein
MKTEKTIESHCKSIKGTSKRELAKTSESQNAPITKFLIGSFSWLPKGYGNKLSRKIRSTRKDLEIE